MTANPRVEALLVREIDEVVGDGDLRWEHLPRLTYLACCQKEALRLHPPVPGHICAGTRLTPATCALGGGHVCAGTQLTAATSAPGLGSPPPHLHRDFAHRGHI